MSDSNPMRPDRNHDLDEDADDTDTSVRVIDEDSEIEEDTTVTLAVVDDDGNLTPAGEGESIEEAADRLKREAAHVSTLRVQRAQAALRAGTGAAESYLREQANDTHPAAVRAIERLKEAHMILSQIDADDKLRADGGQVKTPDEDRQGTLVKTGATGEVKWHHSVAFDGYTHTTACGLELGAPEDIREVNLDVPEDLSGTSICYDCANADGGESA